MQIANGHSTATTIRDLTLADLILYLMTYENLVMNLQCKLGPKSRWRRRYGRTEIHG
jgi:hypothetical protein